MYTSYYQKVWTDGGVCTTASGKLRKKRMYQHPEAVQISRTTRVNVGRAYPDLYPARRLLNDYLDGTITDEQYTEEYNKQLAALDPQKVLADLGEAAVLMCHEAKGKFCHRHLVAAWLRAAGVECEEL